MRCAPTTSPRCTVRGRADGFSLVEALAALTLAGLLGTAMAATSLAQMRLARGVANRVALDDAARTAAWIMAGEADRMTERDVRALARDSIALRAFRGRGIICARAGATLTLRYAGDRLPDLDKDSILLVGTTGERAIRPATVRHVAAGCSAASGEQLLQLDAADADSALVALVFESGTYYLTARALRYRIGAEGRQPLTAELLGGAAARFHSLDDTGLRFAIEPGGVSTHVHARFPPRIEPQ
jgi:type II secretory pathway component PulJ